VNRRQRRRAWRRYQIRIDRLAPKASTAAAYTSSGRFVIRTNPGYFRALEFDFDGVYRVFRRGV
jgi:hypothetical protein